MMIDSSIYHCSASLMSASTNSRLVPPRKTIHRYGDDVEFSGNNEVCLELHLLAVYSSDCRMLGTWVAVLIFLQNVGDMGKVCLTVLLNVVEIGRARQLRTSLAEVLGCGFLLCSAPYLVSCCCKLLEIGVVEVCNLPASNQPEGLWQK